MRIDMKSLVLDFEKNFLNFKGEIEVNIDLKRIQKKLEKTKKELTLTIII